MTVHTIAFTSTGELEEQMIPLMIQEIMIPIWISPGRGMVMATEPQIDGFR